MKKGANFGARLKAAILVLIASELYLSFAYLSQKCLPNGKLPAITLAMASNFSTLSLVAGSFNLSASENNNCDQLETKGSENNGTSSRVAASSNGTSRQNYSQQQQQQQQQQYASSSLQHQHNVLCNSRCVCVILASEWPPSSQPPITATTTTTATPPLNQTNQSTPATSSLTPANTTLIAFSEDYSLDYEEESELELRSGQPGNEPDLALAQTDIRRPANGLQRYPVSGNNTALPISMQVNSTQTLVNNNNNSDAANLIGPNKQTTTPVDVVQNSPLDNRNKSSHLAVQGPAGFDTLANIKRGDLSASQLYAQTLYSSQAPKLSLHAHTLKALQPPPGYIEMATTSGNLAATSNGNNQQQQQNYNPFPVNMRSNYLAHHLRSSQMANKMLPNPAIFGSLQQRLIPLSSLNLSYKLADSLNQTSYLTNNVTYTKGTQMKTTTTFEPGQEERSSINWSESTKLIELVESMLLQIERDNIQSLVLSHNDLQFELWSELHALLATHLRQHLFHLDLSHNSLVKLGLTFSGYLEHHLAVHNSWPQQKPQQNNSSDSINDILTPYPISKLSTTKAQPNRLSKHSLLSGGKLYNIIQQRLQLRRNNDQNNTTATTLGNRNSTSSSHRHPHHGILQQAMLIRALDLSHNKLKWLINDQFRTLKHVQTIRLDHNKIRYIHQHAFSGLESLRFLNLNFNRLQVIYIEQFQTNYNLLALMMRSNALAYLRGGTFASLANLKRLDISNNELTIMSSNAFVGLESLRLLNCSSNQFVHAPSASLHPLTSLRQLDLSENFITKLAPGTFFHMPIEELWLNQNEQLVEIDRGAFWDLPYLRRLHLKSNPMLMSINSQAFVGTQNLQIIEVDGCESLSLGTRQMLDNITMAATSRLLRLEQQQSSTVASTFSKISSPQINELQLTSNSSNIPQTTVHLQFPNATNRLQLTSSGQISPALINQLAEANPNNNKLNYAYYLCTMALLVVALKLVLKYTSTSRYLHGRRRRRRVYEASAVMKDNNDDDYDGSVSVTNSSSSSSSEVYQMCEIPRQIPGTQVIFEPHEQQSETAEVQEESIAAAAAASADDDIYVINGCMPVTIHGELPPCCLECPHATINGGSENEERPRDCHQEDYIEVDLNEVQSTSPQQPQPPPSNINPPSTYDLIHSHLVAAGLEYGHANCAHFYQSISPYNWPI